MQTKQSSRLLILTFIITVTDCWQLVMFEQQFHNSSLAVNGRFGFHGLIYGFSILCPMWLTIKNLQYNKKQILI
jgi:hypothetical protein